MKNALFSLRSAILVALFFPGLYSQSQINVVSSNGYVVDINVVPQSVIPSSSNCTWGYNYNLNLNYQITFTGSNKPSSLYTLQGTVGCGSNSNFFDLPNNGGTGTVNSTSNQWRSTSDCNTVTLSSVGCNTMNIEISGPGISARTVSYAISYVALPITLTGFTAAADGKQVKIKWETASESNNDFFTVQRSVRPNEWIDIEKVKGAGNSSVTLQYVSYDKFPVQGTSYYRIKQTDLDDKFTFSSVSAVQMETANGNIAVFPSPNTGNSIKINGITDYKKYSLSLTDMNERPVYSTTDISSPLILPTLKPGMYLIIFIDKNSGDRSILRYMKL